ncbi:MAG: DUF5915 domain-containing protein, partial [bacterium]|nr:DUF5915 domain-containing protein [bacterium]
LRLSLLMAPFTPFLAEELFLKLTEQESVHLLDWPKAGNVNEQLVDQMAAVRSVISDGLALRSQNSLKVRQPLASVQVTSDQMKLIEEFEDIVKEELNVKEVMEGANLELDTKLTMALKHEGIMREIVRVVQGTRKSADLNVDDRIELYLHTSDDTIKTAIKEYEKEIKAETLTKTLVSKKFEGQEKTVQINKHDVTVILKKAK